MHDAALPGMTKTAQAISVALLYEMAHALAEQFETRPSPELLADMSAAFLAARKAQREYYAMDVIDVASVEVGQ